MMRELKVEDALLYLDQVKVEFGDQPHIYNEFLDIMKTFKTQQIDTPGVIRRVSNLFQGNRRLVLGFNTFLPEGYKIELPDGDGPAIAVYRAPGSNVTHVLTEGVPHHPAPPVNPSQQRPPPAQKGTPHIHRPPPQQPRPRSDMPFASVMLHHARPTQHPIEHQSPMQGGLKPPPPGPQAAAARPPQEPNVGAQPPPRAFAEAPQPPQQQESPPQGPLEFDHAISYVTTIKKRFSNEPYTYKKFLEILHTYQKEQRGIKEVLDEVSTLFADHPDLLKEFTYFLPDTVQAQAKAQLDAVAKEAEDRKRRQSKGLGGMGASSPLMQHHRDDSLTRVPPQPLPRPSPPDYDRSAPPPQPFSPQGRTPEQESNIIRGAHYGVISFAPVKPPRKNELSPAQAALKYGRPTAIPQMPIVPNTAETAFFQRAKEHFSRSELQAEKPPQNKRHSPYSEFVKCLHLFGSGILNQEELLLLLKGLFHHGHAPKTSTPVSVEITQEANELMRDLSELLLNRGPYAGQEAVMKDKSKYGNLRACDFELEHAVTPSYYLYPEDYPMNLFVTNTGQSEEDYKALNNLVLCVGNIKNRSCESLEVYDAIRVRRNAYEEAMFRIEDERYEVDMAIERNAQAMRQIEPFAEEVQALKEQEEKDRQPIGRLQYQLNRYAMNSIHINAIGRLYGEKGDEVLQHLAENPFIVLPIIYQRLKQKDAEWRNVKAEMQEKWNALQAANFEGTLDVKCFFNRREIERRFSSAMLVDECKRARTYCKYPERIKHNPVTDPLCPTYAMSCSDPGAVLYQPYSSISCKVNASHKDAIHLIMQHIKSNPSVKPLDRERIGRVWSEFMMPWFGYPVEWVAEEVRQSFSGKLTPSIVKFVAGQRVVTSVGEGSILSFQEGRGDLGPMYRVKLAFGLTHLSPSAILYAVPVKDQPYVRRDGVMVRDDSLVDRGSANSPKLQEKYEMLFGTDNIYLFLRLYTLVVSLLSSTRQDCGAVSVEAETKYHTPLRKDSDAETPPAPAKVDYAGVLSALKRVLSKKMDVRDYESLGRKLTKDTVHQFAVLPKLIERCANALVSTVKEDCLLHLYDLCKYRQADPVTVRTHCFSVASEAIYRIQYDTTTGVLCFNHLPKTAELLTSPRQDNDKIEDYDGQDDADVPMEDEDPIQEFDDSEDPPNKRIRVE